LDVVKRDRKRSGIGELRHRIVIENLVLVDDNQGGFSETWQVFATVWAKIKPALKDERFYANKIEFQSIQEITIRHLDGLLDTMRIIFNGRIFQIKSSENLQEQEFYILLRCVENQGT